MRDTCFFFLISDYLMADGSLANAFARIKAGASGVLTGNFQVVEEEASRSFGARFDSAGPALVLAPRELMKWALGHLHPVTAGNTVNFPLVHNLQANRLFWRVDENTLLGRFYLMHMICIHPEVSDFLVGSSCDYSFVPEMCPSGRVAVMTDSDDYLVVEMQPGDHESEFLSVGPKLTWSIAGSLGDWTTQGHRNNVREQLVFHAAEIPQSLPAIMKQADEFIDAMNLHLDVVPPHLHRDHPYWVGAFIAHRIAISRKLARGIMPAQIYREYGRKVNIIHRLRDAVFGRSPDVRLWHPRWADFAIMKRELRNLLSGTKGRLLVVSKAPYLFGEWLNVAAPNVVCMETRCLQSIDPERYAEMVGSLDGCLIIMGESEIRQAQALLDRIAPLLAKNGFIATSLISGRTVAADFGFGSLVTRYSGRFLGLKTPVKSIRFARFGFLRRTATASMIWLYRGMLRRAILYYPLVPLLAPLMLLASLIGNLSSFRMREKTLMSGTTSSVLMMFQPDEETKSLPDLSPDPELYARADRYKTVAEAGRPTVRRGPDLNATRCASASISTTPSSPMMRSFAPPRAAAALVGAGLGRQQAGDPRRHPPACPTANSPGSGCRDTSTARASATPADRRRRRFSSAAAARTDMRSSSSATRPSSAITIPTASTCATRRSPGWRRSGFFRRGRLRARAGQCLLRGHAGRQARPHRALGCSYFIDDLEEVLTLRAFRPACSASCFPRGPRRGRPLSVCPSWRDIAERSS